MIGKATVTDNGSIVVAYDIETPKYTPVYVTAADVPSPLPLSPLAAHVAEFDCCKCSDTELINSGVSVSVVTLADGIIDVLVSTNTGRVNIVVDAVEKTCDLLTSDCSVIGIFPCELPRPNRHYYFGSDLCVVDNGAVSVYYKGVMIMFVSISCVTYLRDFIIISRPLSIL